MNDDNINLDDVNLDDYQWTATNDINYVQPVGNSIDLSNVNYSLVLIGILVLMLVFRIIKE